MTRNRGIASLIALAASCIALVACSEPSTVENTPPRGTPTAFLVVSDWSKIPSGVDGITNIYVRTVKIEDMCYVQSASEYDYTYTLTLTNRDCS